MTTQDVSTKTRIDLAKDFRERHQGKGWLPDKKIDEICASLLAVAAQPDCYHGRANIASAVFYVNILINLYDPQNNQIFCEHFIGHCGGWMAPGDSFFDPIEVKACPPYTLDDLFARSSIVEVNSAAIYCAMLFFDNSKNLMGTLEGAGAGTAIGVAAGTGQWGPGHLFTA